MKALFYLGKSIDNVIDDGPGLVFVVFPHAIAQMPLPQLWSVVFFLTLILLGIDSQVFFFTLILKYIAFNPLQSLVSCIL